MHRRTFLARLAQAAGSAHATTVAATATTTVTTTVATTATATLASLPLAARAQPGSGTGTGFPTRALRVVTPFGAGQGPEVLLRLVAERLQAAWGQPVVVDNKPGASGFIAFEAARTAPADGHTLVNMDSFHIGTQPHLFRKLPYDAFKDFAPVTPLVRNHFFIAVASGARWKTVAELLAAARAKAGAVSYGSWAVASPAHLGGALLESATGVQMLHVPFKEPTQLYQAVATGEVDFAYASAISAKALLDAGKLRLLAVAAPRRPEIRERLAPFTDEDDGMSPAEMAAQMQQALRTWGPVIQKAGIRLD